MPRNHNSRHGSSRSTGPSGVRLFLSALGEAIIEGEKIARRDELVRKITRSRAFASIGANYISRVIDSKPEQLPLFVAFEKLSEKLRWEGERETNGVVYNDAADRNRVVKYRMGEIQLTTQSPKPDFGILGVRRPYEEYLARECGSNARNGAFLRAPGLKVRTIVDSHLNALFLRFERGGPEQLQNLHDRVFGPSIA